MQLVWAQCVIEINRAAQCVCARVRSGIYLQNLNFIGWIPRCYAQTTKFGRRIDCVNKKNTVLIYMNRRR